VTDQDTTPAAPEPAPTDPAHPETPPAPPARVPCTRCGYDLDGLIVGKPCPECGAPIGSLHAATAGSSTNSIASLVLGIVSLVGCTVYGIPSIVCGPLAIYFSRRAKAAVDRGDAPPSSLGMATAGLVCGIIGSIIGAVYLIIIVGVILFATVGPAFHQSHPLPTP
jgi:hypothetical protein